MPSSSPAATLNTHLDRPSGLTARHIAGDRWLTHLEVGRLGAVTVAEVPAGELTDAEWELIGKARQSYVHMWGSGGNGPGLARDAFDECAADAANYRTIHYIATVRTAGKTDKVLTLRRVAVRLPETEPSQLPEDLSFWEVLGTADGIREPLAEALRRRLESLAGHTAGATAAQLPVAALGRVGTYPYTSEAERGIDDRNRTAVAYAMLQHAALREADLTARCVGQVCDGGRATAFALHLPDGERVELAMPPTADELELDPVRHAIRLDRRIAAVQDMLLSFPGFWLDNEDLSRTLTQLVRNGVIRSEDLDGPCRAALASPDAARVDPENREALETVAAGGPAAAPYSVTAAGYLSRPRFAKHLSSLLKVPRVAQRVLIEVGDGPYSVCVQPKAFRASAVRLLGEAQRMYCSQIDAQV